MEGEFSTEDLVPQQVPVPLATTTEVPRFWAVHPGDQVARRGPATSSRAWGKVPTIQVELIPPAKTDEELICQF